MSTHDNKQFIVTLDQGTTHSRAIVLDRNAILFHAFRHGLSRSRVRPL